MKPRFITTHPYASHPAIFLSRGPIVYCVEDVDNSFEGGVSDHFRSLMIDPSSPVEERIVEDEETGDKYARLTVRQGAALLDAKKADAVWKNGNVDITEGDELVNNGKERLVEEVIFVPYFFRANRKASKGVSRTGLRQWKR